jgi:hypothetical protein
MARRHGSKTAVLGSLPPTTLAKINAGHERVASAFISDADVSGPLSGSMHASLWRKLKRSRHIEIATAFLVLLLTCLEVER